MIPEGCDYRERGAAYFDERAKTKVTQKLVARLTQLGYTVTLEPLAAAQAKSAQAFAQQPCAQPARPGPPRRCPIDWDWIVRLHGVTGVGIIRRPLARNRS
jgi:hypothetical protein